MNDPENYSEWIAQAIKDCGVKNNEELGKFLVNEYGDESEQVNKWIDENREAIRINRLELILTILNELKTERRTE